MQQVNTEDITVPWGQAPDPLDAQYGKWRLAVFQDVQESLDSSKLYFLYDPVADDNCITTGGRKAMTSLVVFDTHRKCFVGEIPLRVQGRVKFLFALKSPSPAGGTAFALVTQSEDYGQFVMHVWRVNLNGDGMSVSNDPHSLLTAPLVIDSDFICSIREDAPEIVVIFGPGLNVVRVNADAPGPQEPIDRFNVPGAELTHFYDGFLSRGNIYFLSASPDGHLDYSRVHVLPLTARQISTQYCQADQQRGMPPPRKQAALDSISGFILLAGGEIDYGGGQVTRLVDYWVLDLTTFKWNQVPSQMPVPLIEPRLTTTNSGNVYLWGDFDEPLPGMPPEGTHVRILLIRGFNVFSPPPYNQAVGGGGGAYPQAGGPSYPGGPGGGYPGQGGGAYPPSGPGGYSGYGGPDYSTPGPQDGGYGQPGYANYPPPGKDAPPQYAHYPEPKDKKKDCVIA
ncbi:Protein F20D1.3 [Aphelenchoides avenae]|nr:Protein F20D1.3 [Aphelenchus avenae]